MNDHATDCLNYLAASADASPSVALPTAIAAIDPDGADRASVVPADAMRPSRRAPQPSVYALHALERYAG